MSRPSNLSYHPTALAALDEDDSPTPIAPLRSRIARAARPPLVPSDNPIDERLCEEIETLRRYVETAAYLLGQDAGIRYRYRTEIDNLRHVERMLGQIAPLVAAADRIEAADRVADPELKGRLQRKPLVPWCESKH